MIRVERIQKDIEAIAGCSETPGEGASRPTFSPAWGKAVGYIRGQLNLPRIVKSKSDAAGNLHAPANRIRVGSGNASGFAALTSTRCRMVGTMTA